MLRTALYAAVSVCALATDSASAAPPTLAEQTALTFQDLVDMQSIDSITISPDRKLAAFRLIAPSLASNEVTVQWFSVEIDTPGMHAVALGRPSLPLRMPMFDSLLDGQAQWAADGNSLFVQTLRGGEITVNRIAPNGIDDVVASDPADIETFKVLPGGGIIEIGVRASRTDMEQAQERERRAGIHVDRTVSLEGSRLTENFRIGGRLSTIRYADKGDVAREAFSGELRKKLLSLPGSVAGGTLHETLAEETADSVLSGTAKDVASETMAIGSGGVTVRLVQTAPPKPFLFEPTFQIVATLSDGTERRCETSFCVTHAAALRGVSWNQGEREVIIAYEPDYSARTTVYGWKPETGKSRTIRATDGSLDGGSAYSNKPCATNGRYLLCVHAGPTSPPRLVRVDSTTGSTTTLFDPNPILRKRYYNPTRLLAWQDTKGNNFSGILVLPWKKTKPSPLVITSYRCRGFLRGGFTSLAPEQILADRGIAALCVNHNNAVGMSVGADGKIGTLAPHLGAIEAYQAIIDQLAAEKIIDPAEVGMAGHSFTSMVAAYALSHTNMFKTVVIGTGITIDPATLMYTNAVRDSSENGLLEVLNMPHPIDDHDDKWKAISPALNASAIMGSLLIQTPENEYLSAVQLFSALEHANVAVDMYIYPNEGHLLTREPAHQLSRMRRSIDWFTFWLGGEKSNEFPEPSNMDHWEILRNERVGRPLNQTK